MPVANPKNSNPVSSARCGGTAPGTQIPCSMDGAAFHMMCDCNSCSAVPVSPCPCQDRCVPGCTCPAAGPCCPGGNIYPENCPEPTVFQVGGCLDAAHITLEDAFLQSLGRIVQLDVTIKSVCPGKRVAVSIILTELSPHCTELPRGVKHILVPALAGESCRDITLKCIRFSLPEALDACGNTDSICCPRQFKARVIANYVDTDFLCCNGDAAVM